MNKQDFIEQLESSLSKLSSVELKDVIRDYREHFDIGAENGKTEEEISAKLGAPKQIAKEILTNYHLDNVEKKPSAGNFFRAIISVIGLGFFNLIFMIAIVAVLFSVIFTGWAVGIAFVVSPLLCIVQWVVEPNSFAWFELFATFILSGIGMFILIGMKSATQSLGKVFVRYLKYNVSIVKGGFKNE